MRKTETNDSNAAGAPRHQHCGMWSDSGSDSARSSGSSGSSSSESEHEDDDRITVGGSPEEALSRVACGAYHTVAVARSGRVFSYGWGQHGRLGHGDQHDRHAPAEIACGLFRRERLAASREASEQQVGAPPVRVTEVAAGTSHTLFLSDAGEAYACGHGGSGRLGLGDAVGAKSPTLVPVTDTLVQEAEGSALYRDGAAPSQLREKAIKAAELAAEEAATAPKKILKKGGGDGGKKDESTRREVAVAVLSPRTFMGLEQGSHPHVRVVRRGGAHGLRHVSVPVVVSAVAAGRAHSAFISDAGALWLCGAGDKGQLGHGSRGDRTLPSAEAYEGGGLRAAGVRVACVALGGQHTLVVGSEGELFVCGDNRWNKLGLCLRDEDEPLDAGGKEADSAANRAEMLRLPLGGLGGEGGGAGKGGGSKDIDGQVTVSGGGWLVADVACHCVRRIEADGDVLTLAGSGMPGYKDAWSTAAQFNCPAGLSFSRAGHIVVCDAGNGRTRHIYREGFRVETASGMGLRAWGGHVGKDGAMLSLVSAGAATSPKWLGGKLVHAAASDEHSVLLTERGDVFTMGLGLSGRLGHGDEQPRFVPTKVRGLAHSAVVKVCAGTCHTACLTNAGEVFGFGEGTRGQLGVGTQDVHRRNFFLPKAQQALEEGAEALQEQALEEEGFDEERRPGTGASGASSGGGADDDMLSTVAQLACGDSHTAVLSSRDTLWTTGWEPKLQEEQHVLAKKPLPRQKRFDPFA